MHGCMICVIAIGLMTRYWSIPYFRRPDARGRRHYAQMLLQVTMPVLQPDASRLWDSA